MPTVTYNAKRSVANGHILGAIYTLEVGALKLEENYKTDSVKSVALGGNVQVVVNREDVFFAFATDRLEEGSPEYGAVFEFAKSVRQFERFTFDETGTAAVPGNPLPAMLEAPYTRARVGVTNEFTFEFKIRILP